MMALQIMVFPKGANNMVSGWDPFAQENLRQAWEKRVAEKRTAEQERRLIALAKARELAELLKTQMFPTLTKPSLPTHHGIARCFGKWQWISPKLGPQFYVKKPPSYLINIVLFDMYFVMFMDLTWIAIGCWSY